jgi:putative permease
MIEMLKAWYRRYLSDPQAVLLLVLLLIGFTVILTMGQMLMPVLAAIVISYLLESVVQFMCRYGSGRLTAVILVWLVFVAFLVFLIFGMIPLLTEQMYQFVPEISKYWDNLQTYVTTLPEKYSFISVDQVQKLVIEMKTTVDAIVNKILTGFSLSALTNSFIALIVYLVLLPLMVFFFLKDKMLITNWLGSFLPRNRVLASQVWEEMDQQLGNYIRGKVWEILIIGGVSFIVFTLFGLKYAFLLSVIVGLSVLVPYIGATVVTLPVAAVAYFQWGLESQFVWLMIAYLIIQMLDGNLLVPILFGNVVNLHPIAIIVSIIVFGGLWGFWGVFFAIPLATLANAILRSWPRVESIDIMDDTGEVKNQSDPAIDT